MTVKVIQIQNTCKKSQHENYDDNYKAQTTTVSSTFESKKENGKWEETE